MSILIEGMEMPKVEFGSVIVAIRPDGMVEDVMGCYVGKAVPVPPHGRLIDADALRLTHCTECTLWGKTCFGNNQDCDWDCIYHIDHAETVIPASEVEP